ncbi:MAG: hypothetical protein ACRDOU_11885 [Streptosporangiaceae bacterium]
MIIVIHLLQHLGVPSGAAIAIVIAARKFLKGGIARTTARRDHDRAQGSSRDYR